MHVGSVLVAALVFTASTVAGAEPVKAPVKDAAPQSSHPAPVILASADQVPTPQPGDQATAPQAKPHRAMRVTSCRCGGQVEEQPEQ